MNNEKKNKDGKILYISGCGDDDNETVLYALTMPVTVAAFIDHNGQGSIEFYEAAKEDEVQLPVCQTRFIPNTTPPLRMNEMSKDLCLEKNISKTVASWISIFMRDGIFCTDSKVLSFVSHFDLRDIAERLGKNMEDVYNKYRDKYS